MAVHDEIIVVAGPPAAGKTSAARLLAARFEPLGCVIESDFWWTTIVNGYVPPWQPLAREQNETVVRSFSRAAAAMAAGGYTVVLDGVVGPWNLHLVSAEAAAVNADVHYVVLRPALRVALSRATGRTGEERVSGHPALTDEEPVRKMWQEFSDLHDYEPHVIDNGDLDPTETADRIWTMYRDGALRLQR